MEKKQYERIGDIRFNGVNKKRERRIIKAILSDTKFSNVLDVGARDGAVSKVLKELNPKADFLLIDPDAEALKEAKGFKTKAVCLENFESVEKFDLILMISLLEHVEKPEELLKKANRLLTNNGKLVILVPCLNYPFRKRVAWLYRQLTYGTKGRREIEKEHIQLFSGNEVISLLKSNGFSPNYIGWNILRKGVKKNPGIFEKMRINSVFVMGTKERI